MRVALVNMPFSEQEYTKFSEKWDFIEDEYIGVNIVYALLVRGGWNVVRCRGTSFQMLLDEALAAEPDIVMLSVMQSSARMAREFVERLRNVGYGGKVFIGGWFAKLSWRKMFEEKWPVDYVCNTDAEGVFPTWMKAPDAPCPGIVTYDNFETAESASCDGRRTLNPWPANYVSPVREPGRKTYRLETSRGCPHSRCTFCSLSRANVIRGKWVPLPVSTILAEMRMLHESYGACRFSLTDDDMLGPLDGAEGRAREIRDAFSSLPFCVRYSGSISVKAALNGRILDMLVESGLEQLGIGFESADPGQLRRYCKAQTVEENVAAAKNIVERRMSLIPGLITFDPFATPETVARNLDFLYNHLHHYDLGKLTKRLHVISGTPMEKMIRDAGLLVCDGGALEYRFEHEMTKALYEAFVSYTDMVRDLQVRANALGRVVAQEVGRKHREVADRIISGEAWRPFAEDVVKEIRVLLEGKR